MAPRVESLGLGGGGGGSWLIFGYMPGDRCLTKAMSSANLEILLTEGPLPGVTSAKRLKLGKCYRPRKDIYSLARANSGPTRFGQRHAAKDAFLAKPKAGNSVRR